MKKKLFTTAGVIAIASVIGLSVYASDADTVDPLFKEVTENKSSEVVVDEKTSDKVTKAEQTEKLTNEEARELALKEYPGFVTQFELDYDNGRFVYEMDIKGNKVEYELDMDAETGEVIKLEEERDDDRKYAAIKEANLITMEEAETIALEEFSGVIKETELDRDDNRWIYEIKVKQENLEAEFEIDATTGKIIELEIDDED